MTSIQKTARLAGTLYLLLTIVAPIGIMYVPNALYVRGNATATAANITASESLFRLGIFSTMMAEVIFIVLGVVLYRLLREIGPLQALLMLLLVVVSATTGFLNRLNHLAVLIVLSGADFLSVFAKPELDAFAFLFVRLYGHGLQIISLFWGLWLFPFGWLVYKSRFIPKIFGVLLLINGVAYVLSSIVWVLWPESSELVNRIMLPAKFAGELPIMIWFLVKGANTDLVLDKGVSPSWTA